MQFRLRFLLVNPCCTCNFDFLTSIPPKSNSMDVYRKEKAGEKEINKVRAKEMNLDFCGVVCIVKSLGVFLCRLFLAPRSFLSFGVTVWRWFRSSSGCAGVVAPFFSFASGAGSDFVRRFRGFG